MARRLRIAPVFLVGFVSAIVLLVAVGWYAFHNPDRYLPKMTAYLQQKTGLQIKIRHIEVGLFPLSIRVYGLEVENPKPFPAGDFLKVPTLEAKVALGPLLRRQIMVRSVVLEQPVADFISDPDGLWNFQNPSTPKQQPARLTLDVISNVQIKNGILLGSNLIDPADTPGPIILAVRNFSAQLKQIDLRASHHPGTYPAIQGNLQADRASFGSIHTTDLHSQLRIAPKQLTFKNFEAKTYRGHASGDFSFNFGGKNTRFETNMRVDGIGMPYLLAEFQPGTPQHGSPRMTGMMQADLNLTGEIEHTSNPLADIQGTGNIVIRKGELPSLDGDKSMIEMKRFRNAGTDALPPSAFSTFSGDMELRNRRMYSKRIGIDFYGIDVDGSGSASVMGGNLDYRGAATILKKQGFFTNVVARLFKGAKEKNGRLKFPIRITGTMANPQCSIVK